MPQSSVAVADNCRAQICNCIEAKAEGGAKWHVIIQQQVLACCRIISTATSGIKAARQALESYIKESKVEKRIHARCMPDVPYKAERRTYLLVVGQAISNDHMTYLFQVVEEIYQANLLGLVVIDELQM